MIDNRQYYSASEERLDRTKEIIALVAFIVKETARSHLCLSVRESKQPLGHAAASNTEKCSAAFLQARTLVNPEIESARAYTLVFFHSQFLCSSLSLSFSFASLTPATVTTVERNGGRFISTPVAIVPFVSQPALHASRQRQSFLSHLFHLSACRLPLFFSPFYPSHRCQLCHPCSSWQIRALDGST